MQQAVQGEVEQHTQALQAVRIKLAPWEQQISEAQSAVDVALSEQKLLQDKHVSAEQQLQVRA